jgi:Pyruvate/2-oxoacid:ferredoxin oxidoreductase delta subunit
MKGQLEIYYFSGTGNARNVALWIGEEAQKRAWDVRSHDLAGIDRRSVPLPGKGVLVGFISPTHGFNLPPVMMYFVFRFPRTRSGNRVFVINTRAGMKAGRVFLPGLSGLALWLPALVLMAKGYRVVGLRSIDLPSNWISLHPGLTKKSVVSIYERCRAITVRFAGHILDGRKDLTAFRDIVQDCLAAPISVLYFLMGRFVFAKSFYADSRCTKCNLCIRNCPVKAITVVGGRPFWTFRCESCMRCMNECPERAIETGHGYVAGALFLAGSWVLAFFWRSIPIRVGPEAVPVAFPVLKFLVDCAVTLFILMLVYRVVHFAKRVMILRQVIEYTSLTKYRFWKRYNIKEMFAGRGGGGNDAVAGSGRKRTRKPK